MKLLASHHCVTEVDLGRNDDLSDAVKRLITQALLRSNGPGKGIAAAGTCKFFDFETCEEIELSGMSFTDDDIAPICTNLGRFRCLKSINFGDNNLTDVGGRAIVDGLQGCCGVTEVDLGRNFRLNDTVKKKFQSVCLRNQDEFDQRAAEIAAIQSKYERLMSSRPDVNFDCSLLSAICFM